MQWAIAKAILKRAILSYFGVQWQENRRKEAIAVLFHAEEMFPTSAKESNARDA